MLIPLAIPGDCPKNLLNMDPKGQYPTTNIKSDMICVKLKEITE